MVNFFNSSSIGIGIGSLISNIGAGSNNGVGGSSMASITGLGADGSNLQDLAWKLRAEGKISGDQFVKMVRQGLAMIASSVNRENNAVNYLAYNNKVCANIKGAQCYTQG